MTLSDYKLIGLLFYYGFLILFGLAESYYKLGGSLLLVGRGFAVAYLAAFSFLSTDGQKLDVIKAELEGSRPSAPVGGMRDAMDRVVFWGALAAAVFFAWRARWWDAVCVSGYPIWRVWLMLEVRRINIQAGNSKPAVFWPVAMWVSLAAAVISLVSIVVSGPSGDIWATEAMALACAMVCFLIFFIGNGRRIP